MQRRETLKTGFALLGTLGLSFAGFIPVTASAFDVSRLRMKLVAALRSIDNEACAVTATRLEAAMHNEVVHLHLRGAGLNASNAAQIANVLRSLSDSETAGLVSFSLSYNKDIGNIGAIHLARALPRTLPEFGLVGCKVGETGGTALLEWAEQATGLRMLCIEGNDFSAALVSRFRALAQAQPHPSVYV